MPVAPAVRILQYLSKVKTFQKQASAFFFDDRMKQVDRTILIDAIVLSFLLKV